MQVEDYAAVHVLHRDVNVARVGLIVVQRALALALESRRAALLVRIAPDIDRHAKQLLRVLGAGSSARSCQSDALLSFRRLDSGCALDSLIELGLRLVRGDLEALASFLHEPEGIILAALIFGLRVDAEVEADGAALGILDLPVTVEIPQLLEVEEALLGELVAGVGGGVCLVPLWVVFIVLVCSIIFFSWFRRLNWLNWLLLLMGWLLVMLTTD